MTRIHEQEGRKLGSNLDTLTRADEEWTLTRDEAMEARGYHQDKRGKWVP